MVEELSAAQGGLRKSKAEEHPQRSIITRALRECDVDTMTFPRGTETSTCSAVTVSQRWVSDDEIRADPPPVQEPAERSQGKPVEAANGGGGRDNITAVAFRVADADAKGGRGERDRSPHGRAGGADRREGPRRDRPNLWSRPDACPAAPAPHPGSAPGRFLAAIRGRRVPAVRSGGGRARSCRSESASTRRRPDTGGNPLRSASRVSRDTR